MYPISNAVKALFDAEQPKIANITGHDKNGNPITIHDSKIMEGGFSIDRYACNGDRLEIGTAVSAELTLSIDNRDGSFSDTVFEGAELFVQVGIADWTQENPEITYIPCGYFIVDEQPRALSTISLTALDRMMLLEKEIEPNRVTYYLTTHNGDYITDASGNKIVAYPPVSNFPCTVKDLVAQCCEMCGVLLGQDISSLPNANYVVSGIPDIGESVTYRNLIQWAAGLMGTNAWMDWGGKLRFSWFNNATGYTTTIDNRYSSDMYEDDIVISGITYTDLAGDAHISGGDSYTLDLSGNYLVDQDNIAGALDTLYVHLHAFQYRPFKASVVGAPYLWPMDRMTFTDKNGNGHVSSLTNVNFSLNGTTAIAAKGETAQRNKYAKPGAFTGRQKQALQVLQATTENHLNEAVENATEHITGASGGHVRFMYDSNGELSEILIMDTDDITTATKVWRWNSGGLGYSSNGYAGPYGLAMTQDGAIVANFITSGTLDAALATITNINASNISTGTLSADRIQAASIAIEKLTNEAKAALISTATVKTQYYKSTSDQNPTGGSWQDTVPTWANGYYLWTRVATTKTYANGTTETTYSSSVYDSNMTTAIQTAYSAAAEASEAHAAVNGAVVATVPVYYRSTTETTPSITTSTVIGTNADTDNAWEYIMPRPKNGRYFYSCEKYTFADGSTAFSTVRALANLTYTSLWCSANNSSYIDGASIYAGSVTASQIAANTINISNLSQNAQEGIVASSTTKQQYYLSTSEVRLEGGSWSDYAPDWVSGKFIWTRMVTTSTMADGETTRTVESTAVYDKNLTDSLSYPPVVNLLPTTYAREFQSGKAWVDSGVTWTVNSDGSVTATGTLTGYSSQYTFTGSTLSADVPVVYLDPTKKYTLSGCPSGGSSSTYSLAMRATAEGTTPSSSSGTYYGDTGSGVTSATGFKYAYVTAIIHSGTTIPSGGITFYPMLEAGDKVNAYVSTHIGNEAVAQRARTASAEAASALSRANGAIEKTQLIYISRTSATNAPSAPTSWVSDTSGAQNTWTLKRPVYTASYPVMFVATQMRTMDGTYSCTTPEVDQTTTVIDGGHITTGTIDAGTVNVTNINADNITGGTINGNAVSAKQLQIKDANNRVIATFDSTITIGVGNACNAYIDFNTFELGSAFKKFVSLGDWLNSEGYAEQTELFEGDGTHNSFELSFNASEIETVEVGGTTVPSSGYSYDSTEKKVTLVTTPASGAVVSIAYKTTDSSYHFDLGERKRYTDIGGYSTVVGYNNTASAPYSYAEGMDTKATATFSHAEGWGPEAAGSCSHAEGYFTSAEGKKSHAEGDHSTSSGEDAHAEGDETEASGDSSHAEGRVTVASGWSAHAEGTGTEASDNASHAEGGGTKATAWYSHAEGGYTTASGSESHAEGSYTTASGHYSHAEGENTTAHGIGSHAEGSHTRASYDYQHVVGRYNTIGSNYAEIVGNGNSSTSGNARTLTWTGNEWIQGTYTQGSDARFKTEIGPVPDVSGIRAKRFVWNDKLPCHDDNEHVGYFAQEVEAVTPIFVRENDEGVKSLDYIGLLCAKIDWLERRVAELEKGRNNNG